MRNEYVWETAKNNLKWKSIYVIQLSVTIAKLPAILTTGTWAEGIWTFSVTDQIKIWKYDLMMAEYLRSPIISYTK